MAVFFLIIGILSILYFLAIAFIIPHATSFFVIWLAVACICFVMFSLFRREKRLLTRLPLWFRRLFAVTAWIGVAVFIIVEGCIISQFWIKAPADLDYIVVLGAQMKDTGPSKVLQMRLDAAYDYLAENENTKAVLSGGQGPDEIMSEAQGMYNYLTSRGISPERLILEDRSTSTYQNLNFSSGYLDKEKDKVGVVTNNFHVFRAKGIAKKAGYTSIYGIAARSETALQINNMTREFFAIVKDFLVGNL